MTRWLVYFSIFGHLQHWKLAQQCNKFAKVGSAFSQVRNKLSKFFPKWRNFTKSGHTVCVIIIIVKTIRIKFLPKISCFFPFWISCQDLTWNAGPTEQAFNKLNFNRSEAMKILLIQNSCRTKKFEKMSDVSLVSSYQPYNQGPIL